MYFVFFLSFFIENFNDREIILSTSIGFFTDLHARIDSPSGRIDYFRKSVLLKLEEMGQIWKDNKVDVVAFGGDLFHTPDPVNSIKYDVMQELKLWNLPIVAVIGSHDYFGYQMKTLKRTAVGIFHKAGLLDILGIDNPFFGINNVRIYATHHSYFLCDNVENFSIKKEVPYLFQIQLVHGDLVKKPVLWSHTLIKDVHTDSDLVLSGHYHLGFAPEVIDNTTFINPGSVSRTECSDKNRIPKTCIIEVDDKCNFSYKFVELKNAIPNPFKEDVKVEDEKPQDIAKLISLISSTEIDVVDIKKQLPVVAQAAGYNDCVIDKAFTLLEDAKKK
jgi:DNA repair exonuclease SbcCD nuclease subunit